MKQNDFEIKQIFAQENELPQIVMEKKQAAYDAIYDQGVVYKTIEQQKNNHKRITQKKWYLPKAAVVMIACFLLSGVTAVGEEHILYLPEAELTDEEMLEIIDYLAKQEYALYKTQKEQAIAKGNCESRLEAMTDEEVDYHYLALWSGHSETSDGLCRGTLDGDVLTEEEKVRYQDLEKAYEEESRVPTGTVKVIKNPEEYADEGIALCREDGNFYLPEKELTDDEPMSVS